MNEKPKLMLVDGMALLFRAFYATAPSGQFMYNHEGIPTNGVQGFIRHLLLAIEKRKPTHVAVCWDTREKTFRHRLFDNYKINRAAPPVEMIPQFDLSKKMTEAFQIPNVDAAGYEADDCIGTLARKVQNQANVSVITGDRDLLQLLDRHIDVHILQKGYGHYHSFTAEAFAEQFGVTPRQFIDVKALMGDASDGYPGVRGIGEKTALKLIRKFGSVDAVLDHLELLQAGLKKKIVSDTEMLQLSRKLAEIDCSVPLTFNFKEALFRGIPDTFVEEVEHQGLKLVKYDLVRIKYGEQKFSADGFDI